MKTFLTMCRIETMKLRRTLALWMIVIAPAVVVSLQLFIWIRNRDTFDVDVDLWLAFQRNILAMWAIFMQPLFAALIVALVYHLDHASHGWLRLFVLPVPRWTVPAAKLAVVVAMATGAAILLFGMTLAGTMLAERMNARITLPAEIPWATLADRAGRVYLASLVVVVIQNLVSLRFSSVPVSLGVGITGTFVALFAASWDKGPYYPWLMPLHVLSEKPEVAARVLWLSPLLAALIAAGTLIYASRRDPGAYQ